MNIQKTFLLLGFILVTLLLGGCTKSISNAETPSIDHPPSLSASRTAPIKTAMLTTSTPEETSTLISVPTFPVDEARVRLLELLANNSGCRLPCLWGIIPGTSIYQEAQTILIPFSSLSHFSDFSPNFGHIAPRYTQGDLEISADIGFVIGSNNNTVSRITFRVQALKEKQGGYNSVFDSKIFGERVRAYMLPQVLSELGIPAATMISTWAKHPTRGSQAGFDMLLLYPNQGVLVHYITQWRLAGENILGCLSNAHVELQLYPSGKGDSFSEFLSQTEWAKLWPVPADSPYWKSVEETTLMSLEQFYKTFRQPTDKCIETPAKLWPTPEP